MSAIKHPGSEQIETTAEVIVYTDPDIGISQYRGTRAVLEAEGIIPHDLTWPERYEELCWHDDQYHYGLRRCRPKGAKGPRKAFIECDWWLLRFEHVRAPKNVPLHKLEREKRALAKKIHAQTPQGIAELNIHFARLFKAYEDKKFQAFLDAIPGARSPKRGRVAKDKQKP